MKGLLRLNKIILEGISLYLSGDRIEVEFAKPATCMAGANGIGKSTFLACICFGITGMVPNPQKQYSSIHEYAVDGIRFAEVYFSGRVSESDRQRACITVQFSIHQSEFTVTRRVFDEGILSWSRGGTVWKADSLEAQRSLENDYKQAILEDAGLSSFEQVIFLVTFVFTFDERRHLLFWDEINLTMALQLFLDIDPNTSAKYASLTEDISALESRARNYRWQAKKLQDQRDEVMRAIKQPERNNREIENAEAQFRRLEAGRDRLLDEVELARQEKSGVEEKVAELSSRLYADQQRYSILFSELASGRSKEKVAMFPAIDTLLNKDECPACGATGVKGRVLQVLNSETCPLCQGDLGEDLNVEPEFETLTLLDQQIAKTRKLIEEETGRLNRLKAELDAKTKALDEIVKELQAMEQPNLPVAREFSDLKNFGEATAQQILYINMLADDSRTERDNKIREAEKLRSSLADRYRDMENRFVPSFQRLARLFTGLVLDLHMNERTIGHTPLLQFQLELNMEHRSKAFQLSESQRFFIDIALRMTLLEFFNSDSDNGGFLLIDTPEGSLDIAYENNAGKMFASFVRQPNTQVIMTTNLNSSGLIRTMAAECGDATMSLEPMTRWATLSDVQRDNEDLLTRAYNEVARLLKDQVL